MEAIKHLTTGRAPEIGCGDGRNLQRDIYHSLPSPDLGFIAEWPAAKSLSSVEATRLSDKLSRMYSACLLTSARIDNIPP